jgi:predicted Fe-S protein YdhL (DUF1289 family)
MAVASPCVDICKLDGRTGYCVACLRTGEEIRRWRKLTDTQRHRILAEAKRRQGQLDRAARKTEAE